MSQRTLPASEATATQPSRHMHFDFEITPALVQDVATTIWKNERYRDHKWPEMLALANELLVDVKEQLKTAVVRERVPAKPRPVDERALDGDPLHLGDDMGDFQP